MSTFYSLIIALITTTSILVPKTLTDFALLPNFAIMESFAKVRIDSSESETFRGSSAVEQSPVKLILQLPKEILVDKRGEFGEIPHSNSAGQSRAKLPVKSRLKV